MKLKTIIQDLSEGFGIGNSYEDIHPVAKAYLEEFGPVTTMPNGNLICPIVTQKNPKKRILLDAHLDEIGFIVTYVTPEGFLKFAPVGAADKRLLLSQKVRVLGKKQIPGVISCLAPHLKDKVDGEKSMEIKEMYIDLGMDQEEVLSQISLGDYIVFDVKSESLLGNEVTGKSLDNRVGCASLLYTAQLLKQEKLSSVEVCILFSVKEEVNAEGAITGGNALEFDTCIAVDVSFARAPGVAVEKCGEIRKGTMIGITPILDSQIASQLQQVAKKWDIPYQLEIMHGRTSTNADALTLAKKGVPTGLLSIPIKNMHSGIEVVDVSDVESTGALLCAYIKEVDDELLGRTV